MNFIKTFIINRWETFEGAYMGNFLKKIINNLLSLVLKIFMGDGRRGAAFNLR